MIDLGYYFLDSQYGQFLDKAKYTNTVYEEAGKGYYKPNPSGWWIELKRALQRAVDHGFKIHLNLQSTANWGAALRVAKPFWPHISLLDVMDEPDLKQSAMRALIGDLKRMLVVRGLPIKPIGAVFSHQGIVYGNGWQAPNLNWIGVEAYVDPPGGTQAQNLTALRRKMKGYFSRLPAGKPLLVVGQAYSRNYLWKSIPNLVALQRPTYDLAKADPRVFALRWFSYARPSGAMEYPGVLAEHRRIAASNWS